MQLVKSFYKLPFTFDADRLLEEANGFAEDEWRAHPSGYEGNTSMILVAARGEVNDELTGQMLPTEKLARMPYARQIFASFNTPVGRARLMRLEGGAKVAKHTDINYYWRNRMRIHVPVVTNPEVKFTTGNSTVHMQAGECWVPDTWKTHNVENPVDETRIHLVMDTVGTAAWWDMLRRIGTAEETPSRHITFDPDAPVPELLLENNRELPVMSAGEIDNDTVALINDLLANEMNDPQLREQAINVIDDFRHEWRALWVIHGVEESGWPLFQQVINQTQKRLSGISDKVATASNNMNVKSVLQSLMGVAISDDPRRVLEQQKLRRQAAQQQRQQQQSQQQVQQQAQQQTRQQAQQPQRMSLIYDRPVFIVASPRSGSTLLFETLANSQAFVSLGDEAHAFMETIPGIHPKDHNYDSNRLIAKDATPQIKQQLMQSFTSGLQTAGGVKLSRLPVEKVPKNIRFLEKTPKNALRIPFLKQVFPDAKFIFLYREAKTNISSLMDSWRSGRYKMYKELPGWNHDVQWSHLLTPGWRELVDQPLAQVVKTQWQVTNQIMLDDLKELSPEDWCSISYENLIDDPAGEIERLCKFSDVPFGPRMQQVTSKELENSKYTLSTPDPDKWKKNQSELMPVLTDDVQELYEALKSLEV